MKYYGGIIKIAAMVILLPVVLGKCTFSKTIQLYNEFRQIQTLETQLANDAVDKSIQVPVLLYKENLISNGYVIELISPVCEENNVTVKQYEPQLLDQEGDYKLYTANLILSGNYIDLVKTMQNWEENIHSIKISTLKFEYDAKTMKDEKVEMTVVMMQVESS